MFLEIDHVNGGGSAYRRANKDHEGFYRGLVDAPVSAEFQILCSNCNRGRWRNGGICPHKAHVGVTIPEPPPIDFVDLTHE